MADAAEERVEYITIVGNSFEEVTRECQAQRLHEKQYAIVQPIQRHQITMAGSDAMNGRNLVTATFARRTSNPQEKNDA